MCHLAGVCSPGGALRPGEELTDVMLVTLCEPRSNWTIEFKYIRAI